MNSEKACPWCGIAHRGRYDVCTDCRDLEAMSENLRLNGRYRAGPLSGIEVSSDLTVAQCEDVMKAAKRWGADGRRLAAWGGDRALWKTVEKAEARMVAAARYELGKMNGERK